MNNETYIKWYTRGANFKQICSRYATAFLEFYQIPAIIAFIKSSFRK